MIPTDTQTRTVTIQHGPSVTGMTGDLRPDDALPAPVRALIEELAVAEKWPTPEGWCYRCGLAPCITKCPGIIPEDDGTCAYDLADPVTLDTWAMLAAGEARHAVGIRHDGPGRRELTIALARALERIA